MAGTITTSGLSSGIDTASIVDQLVKLESQPITQLQTRQTGVRSQISALGTIITKLATLQAAARDLGSTGVLAAQVSSSNTAFSATPGASALAGRYALRVDALATASKWRSGQFASPTTGVLGGSLQISAGGRTYDPITVADGTALADVAFAIRQSGAPVSATVLTARDGSSYLSITARDTGFSGADPSSALSLAFTPAGGGTGQAPLLAQTQAAQNAAFNVDGLDFVRQGNTVTDAIPGVSLTLKQGAPPPATTGTAEDLVLATDPAATQTKLQKFVDAYNGVMSLLQAQLNVTKGTSRASTLAGDSTVRALQGRLQSILTTRVAGLPSVRTLADVGVKTARDGSLSIDTTTLTSAIGRDPAAIDALFSTTGSGLADVVSGMVDSQTRAGDGILTSHQTSLNRTVSALDDQMAALQRRVDAFRANLQRQFAAMESTVSNLKASGNFLTSQLAANSGSL
jgi:flagellar hook-associated protein 2